MIARNMADAAEQSGARTALDGESLELRQRVQQFLASRGIHGLEDVLVDVNGGVVTLRGTVASSHDRWLCVNCSRHVAGVLRVLDELRVAEGKPGRRRSRRPR